MPRTAIVFVSVQCVMSKPKRLKHFLIYRFPKTWITLEFNRSNVITLIKGEYSALLV